MTIRYKNRFNEATPAGFNGIFDWDFRQCWRSIIQWILKQVPYLHSNAAELSHPDATDDNCFSPYPHVLHEGLLPHIPWKQKSNTFQDIKKHDDSHYNTVWYMHFVWYSAMAGIPDV